MTDNAFSQHLGKGTRRHVQRVWTKTSPCIKSPTQCDRVQGQHFLRLVRSTAFIFLSYGQRQVKRDLRTYAKSVDPDQPQRLGHRVWSGSALFDTRHINGTHFSCCENSLITYRCSHHRIRADLGLHYV